MKILLVIALIISGGLSAAAQERILTEEEYNEVVSRAEKSLYRGTYGPFRLILETEVITEGHPDYRLKSVNLIAPGQGNHRIENRTFGEKPVRTESVTVGNRSFTRNPDGTWKELSAEARPEKAPEKVPVVESPLLEQQEVFKYIGTETFGDQKVFVYTRSSRRKTVAATGSTNESETLTKVLIGTEGTYLKQELHTKNSFSGKKGRAKIITEAQADPTIKITAPETSK